jgi:hypothetical protein
MHVLLLIILLSSGIKLQKVVTDELGWAQLDLAILVHVVVHFTAITVDGTGLGPNRLK